ncbi:ATP-binding protein [Adlercreutzia shanghongiae]|uniref:AAA family ATPase n=1 Tax=Adlercreutzia shanghongiae TaxID=3111773 RepID=A0ABU6IVC8_9ACTN|nr:AAA family ATPase [Adlercreutzia sp. R22]MEC4293771.1 AAA family ATPase [Adlercreutzia sp. R22]
MSEQTPAYLRTLHMERFGRFHDTVVGPFGPALNIVFGPNEAGKTTIASFVGGVLFGWEEARGNRNTYKPEGAERAGSLLFGAAQATAGAVPEIYTLARQRNVDGLQGDEWLVEDIDKDTYRTMFSLNSDELRSLRNTTDTTAKLLTAGSGTGSSPAHALAHVNERLAAFTSRAASAEQSIPQLLARRNELRAEQQAASDAADVLRAQDRELHELEPERAAMAERVAEANRVIEALTTAKSAVESLDVERDKLAVDIERLHVAADEAAEELRTHERAVGRRLSRLTVSDERALRDRLETLAARQSRQAHAVETARANYTSSAAVYEALQETADEAADRRREHSKRRIQVAFCVVIPAVLFLLGVPLFIEGRDRGSLSYMAIGLLLSVFAALMAVGGFALLFRPDKEEGARKARFDDAHWVMVQDKKKLEACEAEENQLSARVAQALEEEGLAEAQGSVRQARAILDEAREVRQAMALCRQRQQAAASRCAEAERRLEEIAAARASALERAGLSAEGDVSLVEEELDRRCRQRTGLIEALETMNQRAGELAALLAQAETEGDFDRLKIEVQEVTTRLEEARADFARLLLAKRMLEAAIATWESKRQPEVYARASRLLSLMTDGHWTEVTLTREGALQVADAHGRTRQTVHLSLGTCQQLYLALRIALLECADNVGRSIPILADDILVNFDEHRRLGAARALTELAEQRQVILFTCHEEVARTLKKAAKQAALPAMVINL